MEITEILKVPMDIAVMIAGGVSGAMALLKKTVKGAGKEIPSTWKIPLVGLLALFASLLWFNDKDALIWGNWVNVVAVTVTTVFLAVLWNNIQKPKDKRRP